MQSAIRISHAFGQNLVKKLTYVIVDMILGFNIFKTFQYSRITVKMAVVPGKFPRFNIFFKKGKSMEKNSLKFQFCY